MITETEILEELKSIQGGHGQLRGEEFYRQVLEELSTWRQLARIDDEVLVALKRVEGYEDVAPEIVADDALLSPEIWPEWRVIIIGEE